MARGVNKCIIVGNCGNDPDIRYTQDQKQITSISIATSKSWKNKTTGPKETETTWHRIVFFNQLAKIAGDYLKKGSQVYIEGSLRTRKWQADDGTDRYSTEIVANEMQMLGSRSEQDQGPDKRDDELHASAPATKASNKPSPQGGDDWLDDKMPF